MVTEDDLRRADAEYRAASVGRDVKREERNALVRRALQQEGWTHARVASVIKVSRGMISKI